MVADKINAKPNIFKYLLTDIKMFIIILFYSWNQHYFRLNDKCSDKALIAYKNIIELSYNSTSKLLSNIFLWYPLRFIIFILIIYKIRNFFK